MPDDPNAPTVPETVPSQPLGGAQSPGARYALRGLLGKGGMGEVWLAHDTQIDREIAIKLMRGGGGDPDATARFLREARVQARLDHPSVVPVHDLGVGEASPYFTMKRLTGTTLAVVLAGTDREAWPRRTLLARFVDVCLAVEFAHQRGVIHRDLKPANIMLGNFGETYVLDWGLARITGETDGAIYARDLRGDTPTPGQTKVGVMLGTPGYMAPEQMRGEPIDRRADVYALGCILFEILAGCPAIARDAVLETTLSAPYQRPSSRGADVPPELDDLCARATAAAPADRIGTARALADDVQRFLDGDRDLERRRELSDAHVRRARSLIATDGSDARAEAMREAGSAIALDAGNRAAQQVLAHLLLEPPRETPAAARAKIEEERQLAARTVTRFAMWAYWAYLLAIPVLHFVGATPVWPLALIGAEVAVLALTCGFVTRQSARITRRMLITIVGLHASLLATVGILLGPLLLLPTMVFGSSMIMVTVQLVHIPRVIVVSHLLALAVPLALEWLGLVPRTYQFAGNALVLKPWALEITPLALIISVLGLITMQMIGNAIVLDAQRRVQDRAQELLHVQKWQLEQLVPSAGTEA